MSHVTKSTTFDPLKKDMSTLRAFHTFWVCVLPLKVARVARENAGKNPTPEPSKYQTQWLTSMSLRAHPCTRLVPVRFRTGTSKPGFADETLGLARHRDAGVGRRPTMRLRV